MLHLVKPEITPISKVDSVVGHESDDGYQKIQKTNMDVLT